MGIFRKIGNALARFMYGRNGTDQLNNALLVVYLALFVLTTLLNVIFKSQILYLLFDLLLTATAVVLLWRTFSKNLAKRRAENSKFMRKAQPVLKWLRLQQTMRKDKEHRYFKCPKCGQHLRVPKGKGTITVHCRGCGASFQEKS